LIGRDGCNAARAMAGSNDSDGAAHDGTTQWYDIGAAFLTMSPEDRQLIERFANQ